MVFLHGLEDLLGGIGIAGGSGTWASRVALWQSLVGGIGRVDISLDSRPLFLEERAWYRLLAHALSKTIAERDWKRLT